MNLTPKERFTVIAALVEMSERQRQMHGGTFLDRFKVGESFMLSPAEQEELAGRIEDEGEPNGDLVS